YAHPGRGLPVGPIAVRVLPEAETAQPSRDAHLVCLCCEIRLSRCEAKSDMPKHAADSEGRTLSVVWGCAAEDELLDWLVPFVALDKAVLYLVGDCFETGRQPPFDALAVPVQRFGPQLLAVALDGRDVGRPVERDRPATAIAGDVEEFELVGGCDKHA